MSLSNPSFGDKRAIEAWHALSDVQFAEVRRAMSENLVVAFRGQHKAFVRRFGALHQHTLSKFRAGERAHDPEILAWCTNKDSQCTAGEGWHSDVSCDEQPIRV